MDQTGVRTLLWLTAAGWLLSAFLLRGIRARLRPEDVGAHRVTDVRRDLRDLVAGLRRLRATPPALGSIVSASLDQLLVGVVTTLSLVVFRERFQEGVASYGRIVAAGGVGILVGMATVGALEPRMPKPRIVAIAFASAGVICLGAALALTGPVIVGVSFVLGITFAYRKVPADTIVQEAIPDRYRGRVFAAYDLLYSMARPVGVVISVPLIAHMSTEGLLALVGLVYLLWTPVLPRWVRLRARHRLRVLAYAGSRADEVPRRVVLDGEDLPVEPIRSWRSAGEAGGEERLHVLLRLPGGGTLEASRAEPDGGWTADSLREPFAPEDTG